MRRTEVLRQQLADAENAVLTVKGGGNAYRRKPCEECPWRRDNDGSFPAEAFRLSAHTAYDAAMETFACHVSGKDHPATCAGFILASDHNITLRLREATGTLDRASVSDGGLDLHPSYRSMAEANGVNPDDPILQPCRE